MCIVLYMLVPLIATIGYLYYTLRTHVCQMTTRITVKKDLDNTPAKAHVCYRIPPVAPFDPRGWDPWVPSLGSQRTPQNHGYLAG